MFEKKEIPHIKVNEVINSIKDSYKTSNKGYVTYITDAYILELIKCEQVYLTFGENFHKIKAINCVDTVNSKIGTFFYENKIIGDKVGNISSIILRNNGGTCAICDAHADTLDHVLPKSKYVQYTITPVNLVPLCSRCNRVKKDKVTEVDKIIFHPYFHDYHKMEGLIIDYKIYKNTDFIPCYSLNTEADISFKYNFNEVFEFKKVLASLASHEVIKLSKMLVEKENLSKQQANLFLKCRKNSLMSELDPPWKILLYELLVKEFDIFYKYEVLNKLKQSNL
ncbi:HNH endonuclease [Candidatus Enterococcus courvalinii]|uniref:HNH endonuclease n=1 Tax=Candidatus Enterococcus courvalinii TaxID=2815329 RepID=A0ABS3HXR8_9ENTE|nr:HNH endonuclease [Enterococcus sp. MSG2901]MBO0481256.1 HNH endonuclease [Enterococcus sp. MSG2901]